MRRLAGMDASFYYLETPSVHMHVTGVLVLDPSTAPIGYSFARVRELLERRLHLLEPFRRRLVPVPFDLDHPVWVEDPHFHLDAHLHRVAVPSPGSMHELAELVGDVASRPLDHNRPLWDMWVVEGLEHGHIALVSKMHHTAMDGVSGADLMVHLFDLEPDAPDPEPPAEAWEPEPLPSSGALVADVVRGRITDPFRTVRAARRTATSLANTGRSLLPALSGDQSAPVALPFAGPRLPFSGALSPHRVVAFGRAELDDLKRAKSVFGTTVNDVVLAACASTMRAWLADHGGVPDEPLVASVPVSVHVEGNAQVTNQVSAMLVPLPVQLEDPVDQLVSVHEATRSAKEVQAAMGADLLQDMAELLPGALFNRASQLYSRMGLADRHPPAHNLVISNVPGPPVPLYSAGARVVGVYPFGPLLEGAGLNITVLSNMGNMDFGVIADRESVPDVWTIADGFSPAVTALKRAADRAA